MNYEYYTAVISDPHNLSPTGQLQFNLPTRYREIEFISRGAQGIVISAKDVKHNQRVAIKKIVAGSELAVKRSYREFMMMSSISHPNIIRMLSAFTPSQHVVDFTEHYIVMELMDYPLKLLAVDPKYTIDHQKLAFIIYQILCAVNHMNRLGFIHRDLKPENIVVSNQGCRIKVVDFGLGRQTPYDARLKMTDYVVTRYYRAPEIIFSSNYDETIDIWSVGCIMAELVGKKILFESPPLDPQLHWNMIVEALGSPSEDFVSGLDEHIAMYIRSQPYKRGLPMSDMLPDHLIKANPDNQHPDLTGDNARDLLAHMLVIDPARRYDINNALHHPYIKHYHDDAEVNAPLGSVWSVYDGSNDHRQLSTDEWKELLFEGLKHYERNSGVY